MDPILKIENYHNFAWKELYKNKEVVVHRKGAIPAAENMLGIIPGSMSAPGYIVRGKGNEASLQSASHGGGSIMSRTQALNTLHKSQTDILIQEAGVLLIGGGLDESLMAYKPISQVMELQKDLVEIIGLFQPRIVRME